MTLHTAVPVSGGCFPSGVNLDKKMKIEPIGIIHTPFESKEECPMQPLYASDSPGRVEIFMKYEAGLQDIETFSHIYLLYLFDRAGSIELVRDIS